MTVVAGSLLVFRPLRNVASDHVVVWTRSPREISLNSVSKVNLYMIYYFLPLT